MISTTARLLERYFNLRYETSVVVLRRSIVVLAGLLFILLATVIVAADSIFLNQRSIASLHVNDLAPRDIFAPTGAEYVSTELTEQARDSAADAVNPVFDPPDILIARQRTQLARQILDYVDNVRRDVFADEQTKVRDIEAIRELSLEPSIIERIISIESNDNWRAIDDQIVLVLETVMLREEIRETNIDSVIRLLPNQVNLQFSQEDTDVVVSIVGDLIRPNTSLDEEATETARATARMAVQDVRRNFEPGQLVVNGGTQIEPVDFEALQQLGLLQPVENRFQEVSQAFLTSIIVLVVVGLYILRFEPALLDSNPRFLTLLAAIFLIVLFGARLGLNGQIYIFPTSTLALLFVAIISPQIAIIGTLGLAMLVGVMSGGSLEIAALVTAGGIIGALTLKRAERLNNFFFAGLMVAFVNIGIAAIFNISAPGSGGTNDQLVLLMIFSLLNGILTAAAAIAGLYIVTLLFNLPTALKLSELSQPNQPLLQRLLREAPGTYQHSLQVANLSEQAANAISANAELIHVAALYHDIGKMLNPPFFTENQRDIGNPHDTLNDPYRSADIIIGHVTDGDDMARQYRLPLRLREFIREHHGTSQVYVFYKQAVILAGDDESAVDINDFTYPGPKPRSKETAILMLADSCEAAVRSRQPKSKAEVAETVMTVIEGKRKSGQLDESRLTLNDLKQIKDIFIEMLQAIYHPRINYEDAIARVRDTVANQGQTSIPSPEPVAVPKPKPNLTQEMKRISSENTIVENDTAGKTGKTGNLELEKALNEDEQDSPMPEVPRLRKTSEVEKANGATETPIESKKQPSADDTLDQTKTAENVTGES